MTCTLHPGIALERGGIDVADALRQARAAGEILERFERQPGVILADEVGMGKTYVALAVAASLALPSDSPVVVMVPPRLLEKWERDARRFRALCMPGLAGLAEPDRLRVRRAARGGDFLACFDDPPERRTHVVLLANTALHRVERNPFIRLDVIRRALDRAQADASLRRAVARFARDLLRDATASTLQDEQFVTLLSTEPEGWRTYLSNTGLDLPDDPVPAHFRSALGTPELDRIAAALQNVPIRESKHIEDRLAGARAVLNQELKDIWRHVLHRTRLRAPLLIFDEAHHLKNAATRLASLFDPDTPDASVVAGAFDRMLFLTATPFQLGHWELVEVLRRFRAIRWETMPPDAPLAAYDQKLDELALALDRAQLEGMRLNRAWGKIAAGDLGLAPGQPVPDEQWLGLLTSPLRGHAGEAVAQFEVAKASLRRAGDLLRPWVIRHLRSRVIKTTEADIPRRVSLAGRAIIDDTTTHRGIEIAGEARFPFLLCSRAQGILAQRTTRRAYFAEGLASSFRAFLETSSGGRPTDDPDIGLACDADREVGWYVEAVERFVRDPDARLSHPKIEATVRRAMTHWVSGEKVLIFAHFLETIRDLLERLRQSVDQHLRQLATQRLGLGPEKQDEALDRVRRISERLQDRDSPIRRSVSRVLRRWLEPRADLTEYQEAAVADLLLGELATPSFLIRNLPLDRPEVRSALEQERTTADQARSAADAVGDSLARRGGYRARVDEFLGHMFSDLATAEERDSLLADLHSAGKDVVRHADGKVDHDTRRRVLTGFNSPLLPEILVASEVMGEGLDLHLECRHVIHHDLSWNPSTLEQRTGRVDRLRCRAEVDRQSIRVYLPYLEGTADEKMYRVVSDRARWFQVVMGEKYQADERSTDKEAARVPFPQAACDALVLDLAVHV